ncbi:MAG: hypothetical protein ACLRQX_03925 [Turicibacter sanguinis]
MSLKYEDKGQLIFGMKDFQSSAFEIFKEDSRFPSKTSVPNPPNLLDSTA